MWTICALIFAEDDTIIEAIFKELERYELKLELSGLGSQALASSIYVNMKADFLINVLDPMRELGMDLDDENHYA